MPTPNPPPEKKPYQPPALRQYGTIRSLTQFNTNSATLMDVNPANQQTFNKT